MYVSDDGGDVLFLPETSFQAIRLKRPVQQSYLVAALEPHKCPYLSRVSKGKHHESEDQHS
jgi:hypothetical protein